MTGSSVRAKVVAAAALAVLAVAASLVGATWSSADDGTVSYDSLRTGWDPNEAGLSPTNVSAPDFGQLFSTKLDGQVYAQPVVSNGVVLVATENDSVYGLDPVSGAIKWQRNVGAAWPASTIGCGDLTPTIGITSTPVVDAATGTAYFTAKVNDGASATTPHWYMHAISLADGTERAGFPRSIAGSPSNGPTTTFDAETAMQRPGLLLLGGVVYAAFGSHCDKGPYVGYVVGVNATTGTQTAMWATEAGSSTNEAGIWQSGGGLVSDGPGRIILTTGNGVSPAPGPGSAPPGQLAESVVRLQVNADGSLTAEDFFSPTNNTGLDLDDADLGSGGPMAIPDGYGTADHPHLLVQVGKDGRVFLLDRDALGGTGQGAGGTDAALGIVGPYNGVWGHPAFWGGDGGYVYTVTNGGPLRAYQIGTTGAGLPSLAMAGASTTTWGYTSGSPVVTSAGTASGSALVWAIESSGATGANSVLQAYDPVPVNGVLTLRYSAPIGTASKFAVPATDGGRVYVGTRDGVVTGFGRPTSAALTGGATDFGVVPVNTSASRTVTVTATRPVTVKSIAVTGPFAIGSQTPATPVSLAANATEAVVVTATPTATGPSSGILQFTTDAGTISFALQVAGSTPGLAASPGALAFGQIPTGANLTYTVSITNTDAVPTTVTAASGPSGPFTATMPALGSTIGAGAAISIPIVFAPTVAGSFTGSMAVTSPTGSVTVPLSGSAIVGSKQMALSPAGLSFGTTTVGSPVTRSFTVTNSGNVVLTVTKAAPPTAPFIVPSPISEGQQLSPGASLVVTVQFVPTAAGVFTGGYDITSDDGGGTHTITFTGAAAAAAAAAIPSPVGGGWQLNGSARVSGSQLVLTDPVQNEAGDAVFPSPVGPAVHARFTTTIGGGTGADGIAFAILDATTTTPTALGLAGGRLGWAPLSGVAVVLDTYQGFYNPSANFVGIATGTVNGGAGLKYAATAALPTSLRAGSHVVDVTTTSTTVTVSVDGGTPLIANVAVPARGLLAFSGGTGGLTDSHAVSAVSISQGLPFGTIVGINGRCVDVRASGKTNGTVVQVYPCNGTGAQFWTLLETHAIQAFGKCLDVVNGSVVDGAMVDLYTCTGTGAQVWVPQSDGTLLNPQSGRCLTDPSGSGVTSTGLVIATCVAGPNQKWTLPQ
jgi:hypothetical protein